MTTKYAILNPLLGQYVFAETQDEAIDIATQIALNFYLDQTHQSPISVVEVQNDNSEIWRNGFGEIIMNPTILRTKIEKIVGTFPTTTI